MLSLLFIPCQIALYLCLHLFLWNQLQRERVSCWQIGLMLNAEHPEYPFWAEMGTPKKDVKIGWVVANPDNSRLPEQNLPLCAISFNSCGDPVIRGVDFAYETTRARVYLGVGN